MSKIQRIRTYMASHGGKYTLQRMQQKVSQRYFGSYDRIRKQQMPSPEELAQMRDNPPAAGLISVVIPLYNTDPQLLWALVDSMRAQVYTQFEALLFDDCSTREETKAVLRKLEQKAHSRFRVFRGKENLGISGNTNLGISRAHGEYVALVDHDDVLSPDALWRVAECIVRDHPDMIYTDEDRISEDGRNHMDPHYKPDYCPDTLNSDNYICHLLVVKKSVLEEVGGLRSGFDGSQDHDLILRITEKTKNIVHIPHTLYSWREVRSSASHTDLQKCLERGCRAVMEHEAKAGRKVEARPVDGVIRLHYEVESVVSDQWLVVSGESQAACEACFPEWEKSFGGREAAVGVGGDRIRAINQAVEKCKGKYVLVLDASVRNISEGFVREMLMYAQRDDVAGVTAMLTDSRGNIVHGGYALGVDGIVQCICEGMKAGNGAGYNTMLKVHNVSAVSMGCLMVRRDNWIPLDEEYQGGFAMVDLGMRQRENGKWFVITPHATAQAAPSALLLNAGLCEKDPAVKADKELFEKKWGKDIYDPCYSGRFRHDKANFGW